MDTPYTPLRSPLRWFGGKARLARRIAAMLPPHMGYVEVFGGGASVLLAKPPSQIEVYNDVDDGLVTLFRVLREPELFERFQQRIALTLYSRREYYDSLRAWSTCADQVEKAALFYTAAYQSFGGQVTAGWAYNTPNQSKRTLTNHARAWINITADLPLVAARLRRVLVDQRDWRVLLKTNDGAGTCFYLDPPYVPETRKDGGYSHELTTSDHVDLVEQLLDLKGMAILSGYASPVYAPLERAGWERVDIKAHTSVANTRASRQSRAAAARVECLWINPAAQRARLEKFTNGEPITRPNVH
jgi:DNA adenine methylase